MQYAHSTFLFVFIETYTFKNICCILITLDAVNFFCTDAGTNRNESSFALGFQTNRKTSILLFIFNFKFYSLKYAYHILTVQQKQPIMFKESKGKKKKLTVVMFWQLEINKNRKLLEITKIENYKK